MTIGTKKHFDTYLTKLEAIRGKATRERETAREKRRRNEGGGKHLAQCNSNNRGEVRNKNKVIKKSRTNI